MGLFDFLGKKNGAPETQKAQYRYQYTPEQEALVEQFIEQNFGPIQSRITDLGGSELKLELCLINPNENNPSYLLVTKGLGAYLMAMGNQADPESNPSRLELILDSGEPWEIGYGQNRDVWAQDLIVYLAKQMISSGLSIGKGVLSLPDLGVSFDGCAERFMVQSANDYDAYQNFASSVALNSFDQVTFFLLADMDGEEAEHTLVPSVTDDDDELLDDVQPLVELAPELKCEPSAAFNRVAVFVDWAKQHNFIAPAYLAALSSMDTKSYVEQNLEDLKVSEFFTPEGTDFINSYYQLEERVGANYIDDVISLIWESLGSIPEGTQDPDESCLFLQLDDATVDEIYAILDARLESFEGHHLYDNADDEELYNVLQGFLPGETLYFGSTNDDYNINATFAYGHEYNLYTNFRDQECPLVVELNYDYVKGLLSYLSPNNSSLESFTYSKEEIDANVAQALRDVEPYLGTAPAILERLMANNMQDLADQGLSLDDIRGSGEQFADDLNEDPEGQNYEFNAYWRFNQQVNPQTHAQEEVTSPVAIAYLPVERPYQTLAYVPFVPTDCGMSLPEIMAIAAYFEERYQAYVGLVSVDTIEFVVAAPLSENDAFAAAQDLYAFCPYIFNSMPLINQTISSLAAFIMKAPVWTCNFDPQVAEDGAKSDNDSFSF